MKRHSVKIGVRQSRLAQVMAKKVKDFILRAHNLNSLNDSESFVKLESFLTKGDQIKNKSLTEFGGKGLFTKEIEIALLENRIDIAVHSAKDMPTFLPKGLKIAGYLKRLDARDAFISCNGQGFFDLPPNSLIGTAALRRQALIKKLRPDLRVSILRGNVDTRLEKVNSGLVDGTFLAMCGLKRLNLENVATEIFSLDTFPPAPGQGAICLEVREDDHEIFDYLTPILDQNTFIELECEREFLKKIEGSCRTPLACYASIKEEKLKGFAQIYSSNGSMIYEARGEAKLSDAKKLGADLAKDVIHQAGDSFFKKWYA